MNISELQAKAYAASEAKGFHESEADRNIPSKMMLVVSEIAEALEEYRATEPNVYFDNFGKPEGTVIELADAVIRIGDLVGMLGGDLEAAIITKMKYNETRPHRHGGRAF